MFTSENKLQTACTLICVGRVIKLFNHYDDNGNINHKLNKKGENKAGNLVGKERR